VSAILSYFAEPGRTTELDEYAEVLSELPSDPQELARVVRGLLIHEGLVAPAGLDLPPERFTDRERTGAAAILQRVLALVSDDGAFDQLQRVFRRDDRLRPKLERSAVQGLSYPGVGRLVA
jgi:hypothetical protein